MTDLNLSTNLSGLSSPSQVSPQEAPSKTKETSKSDEMSSSAQVAALIQMYTASTPVLYPPEAQIIGRLSSVNHDIVDSMLDKWIEQIRELAKEAEKEALSPMSFRNTQSDAYKRETLRETLAETGKAVEATPEYHAYSDRFDNKKTVFVDLANGMEAARQSGSSALSLIVPMVLFSDSNGSPVTINNIDNMTNPSQLSFQLMTEQAVVSVANASDFAAQLGLIGAMFMVPAMYQAELISQGDKAGAKEPGPKDWKFAEAYDGQMREKVKGKEIDSWIRGMVLGHLPQSDVSPEHLIAMGKAILLCSALALYYRVETSHMTGEEFLAMLDGKTQFRDPVTKADRPNDPRYKLIEMINEYLDQLPKTDKENIRNSLASYMGKNPALEDMIKPAKLFSGALARMEAPAENHEIPV